MIRKGKTWVKMENMWREAITAWFEVLSLQLSGEALEKSDKPVRIAELCGIILTLYLNIKEW
jgi:hypothetical protein